MTLPRSPRSSLPTPGLIGLSHPRASEDLEWLRWNNPESEDLLWALGGAGDPDLALNTLVRLMGALDEADGLSYSSAEQRMTAEPGARRCELNHALLSDTALRVRLIALLGGSTALGDHLVAHPELWPQLVQPLPTAAQMMTQMLEAVDAVPADIEIPVEDEVIDYGPDPATSTLDGAGTYRARIGGAEAEQSLKLTYRTLIMRIAAHDLAGTYPGSRRRIGHPIVPLNTVTTLLADLADAALTAALAVAVESVYGEKPVDTRLAIMAMGKCGARELNYISDVDVIFIAEPASSRATRLAGEFNRIGSRAFFEVDAALRPEGKQGALVRTLDSHLAYYKRWAETWEFQALLKARAMTGYRPLGQAYIDQLQPMVWAASQRDSFVDDVQAMRRRVVENVPEKLRNRELKLGNGGLRDVEFAVQLLQLVHGRSDESLRALSTTKALHALVLGGYVGREDGHDLIAAYEFLRLLEHRLQLHRLRRTHLLPAKDERAHLHWLAITAGFTSSGNRSAEEMMLDKLRKMRLLISSLHRRIFYRPLLNSVVNMSVDTLKLSREAAQLQMAALGYRSPERAYEHLAALASGATRKSKIQAMLLPSLMDWLANTADPDAGLLNYRKLSDAAYDRTWFLRMLRDEGIVGQRLMKILGNSPYTADLIIAAPDIVKLLGDGAKGPKLLEKSADTVARSLVAAAGRHQDPERAISVARSLRRGELARVAAADLLGMMDVQEVCHNLSRVWNAVLEAALRSEVRYQLKIRNRDEAPARIAVIGMGRLGGAELGYGSDADVMFVAEPIEGQDENEAIRWAISVCDQLRTRLAKPSQDPPLEVDLGLRPEGRSGPIVRTVKSYESYYRRWGETWELQALLRATNVAGDEDVGLAFLQAIDPLRYPDGGADQATIREVRRMKARVDEERLPRGADRNTHTKLGRGGLGDVEWTAQLLTLMHAHEHPGLHNTSTLETLEVLAAEGLLSEKKAEKLRDSWLLATKSRNALVLVRGKRTDQLPQPGHQLAQVAGAAGWNPNDNHGFLEHYLKVTRRARQVVDEVFWGERILERES
ncbi:Glutamate-ammonia-ligase adenylyltransferase [Corynebacterium occultum]|uniref:Bifunctional glutamine synthetase adenylyltransferase/adenylyl-removing enzyme n=1 Tax=Corynebacterium occultum TaxID=2675219 RepID=A0A6B8WD25_9CORY|nr:bifunctional [glutamine synthetase] adenylyltransferase/[glutamine synthetase]-adenylyl-L-tyrosine phosphorylase [Corynebacterium occultum]QGU07880.1 Glutamate-ammonia-ligase adenylyltransferase [Corynebacterium occultum]